MTTEKLIDYINSQIDKKILKNIITSKLIEVGWRLEDINEAFNLIEQNKKIDISSRNLIQKKKFTDHIKENIQKEEVKKIDPYREILDTNDSLPADINMDDYKKHTEKEIIKEKKIRIDEEQIQKEINNPIESNMRKKEIEDLTSINTINSNNKIKKTPSVEPYKIEISAEEKPKIKIETPIILDKKEEIISIDPYKKEIAQGKKEEPIVPISQIIKQEDLIESPSVDLYKEKITEEKKPELEIKLEVPKNATGTPFTNSYKIKQDQEKKTIDSIQKITISEKNKIKEEFKTEELIPTLKKSPVLDNKKKEQNILNIKPSDSNKIADIIPKKAILTSYSQAVLSATKKIKKPIPVAPKKKRSFKSLIVILIIILIGGTGFIFVEGYIKIPWSKFSFFIVKKDPRVNIINSYSSISSLSSYKSETNINISSSSLSSITNGLSSGEDIVSKEKDSVSLYVKGLVDKNNANLYDYIFDLKSTILKYNITGGWKYDGTNLLALVPDFSQVLGEDAPISTTVSTNIDDLGLILPEFSVSAQKIIKKLDIYNIFSNPIPIYVKEEVTIIFKNFIRTLSYTKIGNEDIKGVDTEHYSLNANRESTKIFLSSLLKLFVIELSEEENNNIDELLGSSLISSIDVWIGKNDNNIYKFKFITKSPLSKVLWLNDIGIADDEVEIEWTTVYYDLDIKNNIVLANGQLNMNEFIQNIKDKKVNNIINSFGKEAIIFRNAVGSYGKKSNKNGSCTDPENGTIFSPLGHIKGSADVVSSISEIMNSLIEKTGETSSCYSTSKKWALSSPMNINSNTSEDGKIISNSFYCTDSEGNSIILPSQIKGAICE